jgi:predicted ArsR family transcriptional regulator
MDVPNTPRDVLAQPTRAQLFRLLSELRRPVGTEELAERLDLHPNGVRVHLDRLLEAGLAERERSPRGRGRPRDMWTIAADARPGGDPPTAYLDLGRWLARALPRSKTNLRALEKAGREIGRGMVPGKGAESSEERMHATLVSMGFAPQREADAKGALTYKLCNCPYREAASESQELVCTLHKGITRGLLDTLSPETELAAFVPREPHAAGCLVELRGGLADEAPGDASPDG